MHFCHLIITSLGNVISFGVFNVIKFPTEGEGDILFLVRIPLASASASANTFLFVRYLMSRVGGF